MCYCPRYMQLISVVPTDPSVLSKLGELYDSEQDKSQAFQYHYEVQGSLVWLIVYNHFSWTIMCKGRGATRSNPCEAKGQTMTLGVTAYSFKQCIVFFNAPPSLLTGKCVCWS